MDSLVRMTNGEHPDVLSTNERDLLLALFKHRDGNRIAKVLTAILNRLEEGRAKHERFAENVFHALGFLSEEHGESIREATKQLDGWEKRMDSELMDTVVVALRILLREYEHGEDA